MSDPNKGLLGRVPTPSIRMPNASIDATALNAAVKPEATLAEVAAAAAAQVEARAKARAAARKAAAKPEADKAR